MFSWSRGENTYDLGSSDGDTPRSFVSVLSEMTHDLDTCSGAADDDAGEGRMDSKRNTRRVRTTVYTACVYMCACIYLNSLPNAFY